MLTKLNLPADTMYLFPIVSDFLQAFANENSLDVGGDVTKNNSVVLKLLNLIY